MQSLHSERPSERYLFEAQISCKIMRKTGFLKVRSAANKSLLADLNLNAILGRSCSDSSVSTDITLTYRLGTHSLGCGQFLPVFLLPHFFLTISCFSNPLT